MTGWPGGIHEAFRLIGQPPDTGSRAVPDCRWACDVTEGVGRPATAGGLGPTGVRGCTGACATLERAGSDAGGICSQTGRAGDGATCCTTDELCSGTGDDVAENLRRNLSKKPTLAPQSDLEFYPPHDPGGYDVYIDRMPLQRYPRSITRPGDNSRPLIDREPALGCPADLNQVERCNDPAPKSRAVVSGPPGCSNSIDGPYSLPMVTSRPIPAWGDSDELNREGIASVPLGEYFLAWRCMPAPSSAIRLRRRPTRCDRSCRHRGGGRYRPFLHAQGDPLIQDKASQGGPAEGQLCRCPAISRCSPRSSLKMGLPSTSRTVRQDRV